MPMARPSTPPGVRWPRVDGGLQVDVVERCQLARHHGMAGAIESDAVQRDRLHRRRQLLNLHPDPDRDERGGKPIKPGSVPSPLPSPGTGAWRPLKGISEWKAATPRREECSALSPPKLRIGRVTRPIRRSAPNGARSNSCVRCRDRMRSPRAGRHRWICARGALDQP
jgi:hypothetical protein